jgi:hypothetical protein
MTADRIAKRGDWKANPLPDRSVVLQVEHIFSADEMAGIQRGFIPREMEDKWFIFYEDGWLFCHRSWTGNCIYQARFAEVEGGFKVTELRANRDDSQYTETDDTRDVQMFLALLRNFL